MPLNNLLTSNYLRPMFRHLWNNKTFSLLNIFGLAIGIACAGLIFLWVEDELSFDQVHVKKDRLYALKVNMRYNGQQYTMESTPRPMAAAMTAEIPGIVKAARISYGDRRLLFSFDNRASYAAGRYVDPALFGMLKFNFVQGDAAKPFPQLYSLVITESTARKFFPGGGNVIGRIVRIDNKHDYSISGVVKDMPENSSLQFEWLAPFEVTIVENRQQGMAHDDSMNWGSYGPLTFAELDGSADLAAVNSQLKDLIHRKAADQKTSSFLFPMKDWRLYEEFANGRPTGGGRIRQVRMLTAIAWIILLIACINFMNLATATSHKRAKEVGVRKVLGSGKKRLAGLFMGEAFLMSFLSAIVATGIIIIALPAFNNLMEKQLVPGLLRPAHIVSLVLIAVICGSIAGSYPAFYLSSFNPVRVLKGFRSTMGSASFIRKGLVVLQFAVSVVFILGTVVVYLQIQHVKERDLGFNRDNLIEVDPQHDISGAFNVLRSELLGTGLIGNIAISDHSTLEGGDTDNRFKWSGKAADNEVAIAHRSVTGGFVATSGMQMVAGRDFEPDESFGSPHVLINESMANMMGAAGKPGSIIQNPRSSPDGVYTNMTVIGIVKDYVFGNMYEQPGPAILSCNKPNYATFLYVRIKAGPSADRALGEIERVMKKVNPAYPFEYRFVDDQFNRMFRNETLISKVSGLFAVLAIIISCLGLFGLAAFTAEQRTKEIGIRKVLGASVGGIAALLSAQFLKLVLIACGVALPVAWWIMHDWLMGYQYRIGLHFWIFIGVGAAGLLIALATISFQSVRAAMSNPVKSLRSE